MLMEPNCPYLHVWLLRQKKGAAERSPGRKKGGRSGNKLAKEAVAIAMSCETDIARPATSE